MRRSLTAAVLASVACSLTPAYGAAFDVVTLSTGKSIQANILKETADTVWLDLGFDVLAVPRTEIESVLRAGQDAVARDTKDESALFFSLEDVENVPESTPREVAKRVGESVIKVSTPSGLGSGYIIPPEGYAITNAHVIQGEQRLSATVFEQGEREFERTTYEGVRVVAVNNHLDLALIKLERDEGDDRPFSYVTILADENVDVGQEVFAVGNPLGLERTLSTGVVATTQRNFEGMTFVQTTAEINPGNSGGPLFNLKGEVIGSINMGALMADGIGGGIPARYVRDFIRNNEAFAYDENNPNSGYNYSEAPPRRRAAPASPAEPHLDTDGGPAGEEGAGRPAQRTGGWRF